MHIVKTVIFSKDETRLLRRAQGLIDIAYPLASDPLVREGTEAHERAVPDDDPRRRVLTGLTNAFDPVTRSRLRLGEIALLALRDQIAKESTVDWWLAHASDPASDQAKQMAEVLAAERTGQARLVEGALAVVQEALSHLDPVLDDPNVLRSQQFEI